MADVASTGPMDVQVGNRLAEKTRLINVYGSTEACWVGPQLLTSADDWVYMHFAPTPGMQFRETQSGSGQYELVLVRDHTDEHLYSIWHTFPKVSEWSTKDIFSRHPDWDNGKENYWSYEGRFDDLIIFANAAKYNPLAYEEALRSNTHVRCALVVGTGRNQALLLVELVAPLEGLASKEDRKKVRGNVWDTVEKANETAPKHARIVKTHVLFAEEGRPFARAAKGAVMRAASVKSYEREIEEVYRDFGDKRLDGAMPKVVYEEIGEG